MTNQPKAKWEPDPRSDCWRAVIGPYELNIDKHGWSVMGNDDDMFSGEFAGPVDTVTLMLAAENALAAHLRAVADTMTWPEAAEPEESLRDWVNAEDGGLYDRLETLYPQAPSLCGHGCRAHSGSPSHDRCPQAAPIGKVDSVTADGKAWVKFGDQWTQGQPVEFTAPPNTWSANAKLVYVGGHARGGKEAALKEILGPHLIEMWHAGDEGVKLSIDGQSAQLQPHAKSRNPLCRFPCIELACDAFEWHSGYHGHQAAATTADGYRMVIDRSLGSYFVMRGQSEVAKGSNLTWINDGCELAREAVAAYERAKTRAIGIRESRRMAATFLKA